MHSLLGTFYYRIKGSTEDIASMALGYILNNSRIARNTMKEIIEHVTNASVKVETYKLQQVGENLERPDISGINKKGEEEIIIEAKFWAPLTKAQPRDYLRRLSKNGVLLFLVPNIRKTSLFYELQQLFQHLNDDISHLNFDEKNFVITVKEKGAKKYITIKIWQEILEKIRQNFFYYQENFLRIADLQQLIGFCNQVERASFKPLEEKDLSLSIPRQILAYYTIIEKVVDNLSQRQKEISLKGLNKTPYKTGYKRYFSYKRNCFAVAVDFNLWANKENTPFWFLGPLKFFSDIGIANKGYTISRREGALPLYPALGMVEDALIEYLVTQIERVLLSDGGGI